MDNILEIRNLTKCYSGLVAVNSVSLNMKRRTVHALIGPNGAGKTTALSMINGTIPLTSGQIIFDGKDITGMSAYEITKSGIGRTYQNIKLFGTLSVLENLLVGGDMLYSQHSLLKFLLNPSKARNEEKHAIEKAEEILDKLGLISLRNEPASSLAYGRQKVVELARALMGNPSLILLDEPAAGLNPFERKEFISILEKVFCEDNIDLFLIEHNMDVVMNISDIITVLNFGLKIAEGTPKEIQHNPDVIKAYLGENYLAIESKTERGNGRHA